MIIGNFLMKFLYTLATHTTMTQKTFTFDNCENKSLIEYSKSAYLNYAMHVILDRALPHISDGLKPVQRRILYAMSEIGLSATSKPKKSARTVGDVLGKFHPHGDSACYEAMVLMAQPFAYRYPLIIGQGNWGSIDDPKSFAAMRYTESTLSKYAKIFLDELKYGTVDWQPNFDGTLNEPVYLPAQLPNILLNGASGIAVGMSTNIPPHNSTEVINACLHLLKYPEATLSDILAYIPAPDYPSGAEIISNAQERRQCYETGNGSIRLRAKYTLEETNIVIHELPHQTSTTKVLEQIGQQMQNKQLPWLNDIRDESDQAAPVRIVLIPKSNRIDTETLMQHLFATTELEKSFRIHLNIIGLNGKPAVKPLMTILSEWLIFRRNTVIRDTKFRLNAVLTRLHILEGLMIAFLNIDAVIHIIRNNDAPQPILESTFHLSAEQAHAILELKLRHIAKIEEIQIKTEQTKLETERQRLEGLLNHPNKMTQHLVTQLREAQKQHGDTRRSNIIEATQAKAIDISQMQPSENITIILSKLGWIRAAKNHDIEPKNLTYKNGDAYHTHCHGKSNQPYLLFDSNGKVFTIDVKELPSARGYGEPIRGKIHLEPNDSILSVMPVKTGAYAFSYTQNGHGFLSFLEQVISKSRNGKQLFNLKKNETLAQTQYYPHPIDAQTQLLIITQLGKCLIIPANTLPTLTKGHGNKLIQMNEDDHIINTQLFQQGTSILLLAGKRKYTLDLETQTQYTGKRATKGKLLPKGFQKITAITFIHNAKFKHKEQS